LLDDLRTTDSHVLRNKIALQILDEASSACKDASIQILKSLLEEPRTNKYRGTLLYVLHEMQVELPLSFLLNQIKGSDTTFEVQIEIFEMIDEKSSKFSIEEIEDSIRLYGNVTSQENDC
jgi:hypothetical protein